MFRTTCAAAALVFAGAVTAHAADFSFTGMFDDDADLAAFDFSVGVMSTVTLRSYSYAGGTQADGTVVTAGGFDPILSVFDSTGLLIAEQDDAGDDGNSVPVDPVTGSAFDVLLDVTLSPGTYSAIVSQFDNFAFGPSLGDGFLNGRDASFTANFDCPNRQFCDISGDDRTSAFAFDVLNVDTATVGQPPTMSVIPAPAALPLLLAGLGAVGALRLRRRR